MTTNKIEEAPPCFQCGLKPRRESPFCSPECEAAWELGEVRPWGVHCLDCRRDVSFAGHVYMIANELWAQTGLGPLDGQLCLDCLETRLGRLVEDKDFTTIRPRARRSPTGRWTDRKGL